MLDYFIKREKPDEGTVIISNERTVFDGRTASQVLSTFSERLNEKLAKHLGMPSQNKSR